MSSSVDRDDPGRPRLTIARLMRWIAILAVLLGIIRQIPIAGLILSVYVLWIGLIRALIRSKRREVERERRGPGPSA